MPHSGYDIFFPDPGTNEKMYCNVCGSECNAERNKEGPTSSTQAMFGGKRKHDCFVCPHTGESWHDNAIELIKEYRDTKSKRLRMLIKNDILDELDHGGKHCCPLVEDKKW